MSSIQICLHVSNKENGDSSDSAGDGGGSVICDDSKLDIRDISGRDKADCPLSDACRVKGYARGNLSRYACRRECCGLGGIQDWCANLVKERVCSSNPGTIIGRCPSGKFGMSDL